MEHSALSRRSLLRSAALLGVGVPLLGGTLSACTKPDVTAANLIIPSPTNPVRWPIAADNEPIADGLLPEKGPLLVYNYADYISPKLVKAFEAEYSVQVSVTTFNDEDEAAQKIRTGSIPFDVYFPGYDSLGRLVQSGLVRPLNHTYLRNIDNVWPSFTDPWYDRGWRYTVPYTVYSTGIAWRTDQVPEDIAAMPNPYQSLWDTAYRDKTAVIDDSHTAMALVGLAQGVNNVNTSSSSDLGKISEGLKTLSAATNPKVTAAMYTQLPAGQLGLTQMWSGDVINAQYYLPKGTSPDVLRYWFPSDGKGLVDNDLMVVLRGGKNPVLSHLFMDYVLDQDNSLANFGYTGYQPPLNALDPAHLVSDGYLPANLAQAAVKKEWFDVAYRLLELSTTNSLAWGEIWQQFMAGG
jgi:spermidine/putrescine transport system substrate-binding protein